MKTGIQLIMEERERQISQEGWTPEHDDQHVHGELNRAAQRYAQLAAVQVVNTAMPGMAPTGWPWESAWWKPSEDPRRNLVKAGALIAAEIDRLNRAVGK